MPPPTAETPESCRNLLGVKGLLPMDVTRKLEAWTFLLDKYQERVDLLEHKVPDNDPDLVKEKHLRDVAQLEVEGWEIARAQADRGEIEGHFDPDLLEIVNRIVAADAGSITSGSAKSTTTPGSH